MESVAAVLSRTEVICGIMSLLGAAFGYLSVRATAAQEDRKRKAEIEAAAAEAKGKLEATAAEAKANVKVEARRDALAEWQALYGEREQQVHKLEAQNKDQQDQLDAIKKKQQDCEDMHAACEDKHEALVKEFEAMKGTVTKIANGNQ